MPVYDYLCTACDHRADILHGINDPGPFFCPSCGSEGTMRKQFAAPAIHFKGSGWAKKDRGSAAYTKAAARPPGRPRASPSRTARRTARDGAKDGAKDGSRDGPKDGSRSDEDAEGRREGRFDIQGGVALVIRCSQAAYDRLRPRACHPPPTGSR